MKVNSAVDVLKDYVRISLVEFLNVTVEGFDDLVPVGVRQSVVVNEVSPGPN